MCRRDCGLSCRCSCGGFAAAGISRTPSPPTSSTLRTASRQQHTRLHVAHLPDKISLTACPRGQPFLYTDWRCATAPTCRNAHRSGCVGVSQVLARTEPGTILVSECVHLPCLSVVKLFGRRCTPEVLVFIGVRAHQISARSHLCYWPLNPNPFRTVVVLLRLLSLLTLLLVRRFLPAVPRRLVWLLGPLLGIGRDMLRALWGPAPDFDTRRTLSDLGLPGWLPEVDTWRDMILVSHGPFATKQEQDRYEGQYGMRAWVCGTGAVTACVSADVVGPALRAV